MPQSQKNKPPPKEPTPFEKFDWLAKRIVRVPKERIPKPQGKCRPKS